MMKLLWVLLTISFGSLTFALGSYIEQSIFEPKVVIEYVEVEKTLEVPEVVEIEKDTVIIKSEDGKVQLNIPKGTTIKIPKN